jgi:hypothetical protein
MGVDEGFSSLYQTQMSGWMGLSIDFIPMDEVDMQLQENFAQYHQEFCQFRLRVRSLLYLFPIVQL